MDVSSPSAAQLQTRPETCAKHGEFVSRGIALPLASGKVIWSGCPACARESQEQEAAEKRAAEERERQARMEEKLQRAGIPKRFRARTFDAFKAETEPQRKAFDIAKGIADEWPEHQRRGTTIIFSGKPGTGKSHLAIAIAQAVMQVGATAFYVTAREMLLMLRASWDDSSAPSELAVLRMLTSVSLLVIDEVGVQFNTDAEKTQFFSVIDGRYRDQMPMILLTNHGKKGVCEYLGERSFDRLREDGIWVPFDWPSYRVKA
jgi:DNA replication protein DnaC